MQSKGARSLVGAFVVALGAAVTVCSPASAQPIPQVDNDSAATATSPTSASFLAPAIMVRALADPAQSPPRPPKPRQPRPLELPQRSLDDSFRVAGMLGYNGYWTRYRYESAFSAPGRSPLTFDGWRWTHASAFTGTFALSAPGAARRMTVGVSVGFGGPLIYRRAPIPDDAALPFERSAFFRAFTSRQEEEPLKSTVLPAAMEVAPYFSHDIKVTRSGSDIVRVRLGYQFLYMADVLRNGTFDSTEGRRTVTTNYDIRFRNDAHLGRLSFDVTDAVGRGGYEVEAGVAAGTRRTLFFFLNVGAFTRIGRVDERK